MTLSLHSVGEAKRLHGIHGKFFPKSLEDLLLMQQDMSEATMALLEWFVVLLYDRTSDNMNVNDASKQLFTMQENNSTQKSRNLENLPPSQEALKQHIKRACFQSNCWNKALFSNQVLPSPADWEWKLGATGWEPLWTILPEASLSCYELIHCGCKEGCTTRQCKCVKAALQCTALCSCYGECQC